MGLRDCEGDVVNEPLAVAQTVPVALTVGLRDCVGLPEKEDDTVGERDLLGLVV